jgi:hypothetical protein
MISGIGISAYSAYSGQSTSIYGSAQVSDVKINPKILDTENSLSQDDIEDTATISAEAKNLLAKEKSAQVEPLPAEEKAAETKDEKSTDKTTQKTSVELTQEQQEEVQKLKERDAEVRAHEQAHIAAAAGLRTSAPTFTYETGPDEKKYAVGGEVNISFSSGGNPEQDIKNAEIMKAAALAPAQPSGQDQSVAKEAEKIIQDSKEKLDQQQVQQKEEITHSNTAKTLVGDAIPK